MSMEQSMPKGRPNLESMAEERRQNIARAMATPNYRGLGRAYVIGRTPDGRPITTNASPFNQLSSSADGNPSEVREEESSSPETPLSPLDQARYDITNQIFESYFGSLPIERGAKAELTVPADFIDITESTLQKLEEAGVLKPTSGTQTDLIIKQVVDSFTIGQNEGRLLARSETWKARHEDIAALVNATTDACLLSGIVKEDLIEKEND